MSESSSDKAIKKSSEGVAPPPSRRSTEPAKEGESLYQELMDVLRETDMGPINYEKCNMYSYEGRDDTLVNFYIRDPNEHPASIFESYTIESYRITRMEDCWKVENA